MKMRWDESSSSSSSSSDDEPLELTPSQMEYSECGVDFVKKAKLEPWFRQWGSRPFNYSSDCFLSAMLWGPGVCFSQLALTLAIVWHFWLFHFPRLWDGDSFDGPPDAVCSTWQWGVYPLQAGFLPFSFMYHSDLFLTIVYPICPAPGYVQPLRSSSEIKPAAIRFLDANFPCEMLSGCTIRFMYEGSSSPSMIYNFQATHLRKPGDIFSKKYTRRLKSLKNQAWSTNKHQQSQSLNIPN